MLHLTLEFVRTREGDDPHAFSFRNEEYLLRSEGEYSRATFDWEGGFLDDLSALQQPNVPATVVARVGHQLRRFLGAANWEVQERQIEDALGRGDGVVLTVRSSAAELYAVPWELLPLQSSAQALGELPNVQVHYEWPRVRALERTEDRGRTVLVAWSGAGGRVPTRLHVEAIAKAAKAAGVDFDPTRDVAGNITPAELAKRLETDRPKVLHMLCHGVGRDGLVGLALDDGYGDVEVVEPTHLRRLLGPHAAGLEALVLCACRSGEVSDVGGHVGSVAQSVHRAGVRHVIASRFLFGVDASCDFTETLYDHLLDDLDNVPTAFVAARSRLTRRSGIDWASVQLHARVERPPEPELEEDEEDEDTAVREGIAHRIRVAVLHCAIDAHEDVDPDEAMELLHEALPAFRDVCRREIEALGGSVVDENEAAGVLAAFGWPAAGEHDSMMAVRAGMHIVTASERLSRELAVSWGAGVDVRIGVHSGRVIQNAEGEIELHGGPVAQIAVALQEAADDGTVLMSGEMHFLVADYFDMDAGAPLSCRAARRPLDTFVPTNDRGLTSRFQAASLRGLSRMVGREREVALIMGRWQDTQEGRGSCVLVTADAGVGKSRLLQEIRDQVAPRKHRRLECACSPYHTNTSLYPLVGMLESVLHITNEMGPEQRLKALHTHLERVGASIDTYSPPFAELLGLPVGDANIPPKRKRQLLLEGTTALICSIAEEVPVLLVVEDLHWMDPSTAEWLQMVFEQLAHAPVMLLTSTRPQYTAPPVWLGSSLFAPVNLTRLDRREVVELVLEITGGRSLPAEIIADIDAKTDGYPLFVEDLTRMVLESGVVEERDGAFVLTKPFVSLAIPATLHETLMARLAGLADARAVAQVGAAIGREFTLEMHRAVSQLEADDLETRLRQLVDRGLVYRKGLLKRATYIFKHALVQEALYDSMLRVEKRKYHVLIAEIIEERFPTVRKSEPALLAYHFEKAGESRRALQYWELASHRSIAQCANIETLRHTASALSALEALPEGEERRAAELRLHLGQGPALLAVKGWAAPELGASAERAQELSGTCGGVDQHFRITRGLWGYYMVSAQLARSLDTAAELMEIAAREDCVDFRLEADATACDSWFWLGRPDKAAEHGLACLDAHSLEEHHPHHALTYGEDPASICLCYTALSLWLLGRTSEAEAVYQRAVEDLPFYTHLFSQGFVLNGLAWYGCHTGQPEIAAKWGDRLRTLSIDNEFPPWLAIAQTQVGWAIGMGGQPDEGVAGIRTGLAEWRAAGAVVTTLLDYVMIVDVLRANGRNEEALAVLDEAIAEYEGSEEEHCGPELFRHRGELLAAGGDIAGAEASLKRAMSLAEERSGVMYGLRAAVSLFTLEGRTPSDADRQAVVAALQKFGDEVCPDVAVAKAALETDYPR